MVHAEGDAAKVATMRPTVIGGFFPQADLGDVPDEVERAIVGIMERVAA
jgi:acyl-CoA synthetase (NDP forming)